MIRRESFTLCPSTCDDGNENRVIPGTIRGDWKTGDDRRFEIIPEAGLGIRAAPFEPSVSDRNLPTSGTITPLNSEEYRAWVQSRQILYLLDERRRMQIRMLELETQLHDARSRQCQCFSDLDANETREAVEDEQSNIKAEAAVVDKVDDSPVEREGAPTVTQESSRSMRMTRRQLRRQVAESTESDATIPVSSSTTTKRKRASKKKTSIETDQEVIAADPTRRSKRKRNIKGISTTSSQQTSAKKQSRRRSEA